MRNPLFSLQIAHYTRVQCVEWDKPQLSSLTSFFYSSPQFFQGQHVEKFFPPYRIILEDCQGDVHRRLTNHGTQQTFNRSFSLFLLLELSMYLLVSQVITIEGVNISRRGVLHYAHSIVMHPRQQVVQATQWCTKSSGAPRLTTHSSQRYV